MKFLTGFGTTFDDLHSYRDFGFRVITKDIGLPTKIKRVERVPHSNAIYDFSGVYGGQEYEERVLTYVYSYHEQDKIKLDLEMTRFVNHLMHPNKKIVLLDDVMPDFFFMAEVQEAPDLEELRLRGTLTVEYTAYPFRIGVHEEGHDVWDIFNFLIGVAQFTSFNVDGRLSAMLINQGVNPVVPIIESDGPIEILMGGVTYLIPAGRTESVEFALQTGVSRLTFIGTGTISFYFKREVI